MSPFWKKKNRSTEGAALTFWADSKEGKTVVHVIDDMSEEGEDITTINLPSAIRDEDVLEVSDEPEPEGSPWKAYELEAAGEDGKTYWIKTDLEDVLEYLKAAPKRLEEERLRLGIQPPPTTKIVQVSVDVNALIRQLKDGGLTVPYKCPTCGAQLEISGNIVPKAFTCRYCKSKIKEIDIAEFLRTVFE